MATRQRRTPQAAKFAILDAAERRLHDEGPEGVRIQRIAADLGITDAAIHYHFGTREALIPRKFHGSHPPANVVVATALFWASNDEESLKAILTAMADEEDETLN